MKINTKLYFGKSWSRKLAVSVTSFFFLLNIAQAQVTTSQDRTVVTMDISNSCTTSIDDTLTTGVVELGPLGADQNFHDEDDTSESSFQDGFDEQMPTPTVDFSDNEFSHTTRTTGGLFGSGFEAAGSNIVVDDPDSGSGSDADGSGYVDLQIFDADSNLYDAVFNAEITCDDANGYDLHIADTFNINPGVNGNTVRYDTHDIAINGQTFQKPNLNKREGLFRISPNSARDIVEGDLISGFETGTIKHEYIMDLPSASCLADDFASDCAPAGLDPFGTDILRPDPFLVGPVSDSEFGNVSFTLLCDQNGGQNPSWVANAGRIDPFSRGISSVPTTGIGWIDSQVFRQPISFLIFQNQITVDDCADSGNTSQNYGAIPSLVDLGDYDGITGSNPATYSAILSADNWVGYSETISAGSVTSADNFFEVKAHLPNNQTAGTYAGTIILSCLPNLTAQPELDFDGDYIGDDTTN